MESMNQNGSVVGPPGRPPPPFYPSAPPPYYPPQPMHPTGTTPAVTTPYGVPPMTGPCYPPPPAYQESHPGGCPPVYQGGNSLYPDISQLPQPEAAPLGFVQGIGSSSGPPGQPVPRALAPTRPAPPLPPYQSAPTRPAPPLPPYQSAPTWPAPSPPPYQSAPTLTLLGSPGPCQIPTGPGQDSSGQNLQEGQVPPGCVVSWRGGKGLKVFFYQQEGHIVSPQMPLTLTVYKKIGGSPCADDPNLVGVIEVPGCWRLKLRGKNTYVLHTTGNVLHTSGNVYVFNDDSTCPVRVVVLELPLDVTKTMETDLLSLLNDLTDLRHEEEGVVDKITTGVSTVYSDLTKKLNTAVKETVPGAHKSTKWLRKGTGSLVRMGGSLVSKGMHLIADHVPTSDQPQEESPIHTQLLAALKQFNVSKEEGSITYV